MVNADLAFDKLLRKNNGRGGIISPIASSASLAPLGNTLVRVAVELVLIPPLGHHQFAALGSGGRGGIRTHGDISATLDFESGTQILTCSYTAS